MDLFGLDIGAETAEEIALSIIAEIKLYYPDGAQIFERWRCTIHARTFNGKSTGNLAVMIMIDLDYFFI